MINIRKAVLTDLPELTGLFDLYRIYYKKESDLQGGQSFLKERMEKRESIIFVATDGRKLVAFTQLYPIFSSTRLKRLWLLNDLYVMQEFRGKGVSKQLLDAAKELARETRAAGLLLETEKTNTIGNSLYPSAGFALYDENNFYWWQNG